MLFMFCLTHLKISLQKVLNFLELLLPHGILKIPVEFSKNQRKSMARGKMKGGRYITNELRQMGIIQKTKNIYGWQININYDCARLREQ